MRCTPPHRGGHNPKPKEVRMQYDAKLTFDTLRAEIEQLEVDHPEWVVQVFEAPSSAGVSNGNRAALLRQAVLRRVILRTRSSELWVELGEGSWDRSTAVWNPAMMLVDAIGMTRDGRPRVEFTEVEH